MHSAPLPAFALTRLWLHRSTEHCAAQISSCLSERTGNDHRDAHFLSESKTPLQAAFPFLQSECLHHEAKDWLQQNISAVHCEKPPASFLALHEGISRL